MEKMSIHKKLLEIKKQIPYIKKNTSGHNYDYADPIAVLTKINPLMNESGLFINSNISNVETKVLTVKTAKGDKTEVLYILSMIFKIVDVETGEKEEYKWAGTGCNNQEKGFGSALTYAERYFLLKLFNIPTPKDDPDQTQGETGDIKYESTIAECAGCGIEITQEVVDYSKHYYGKALCRECQKKAKKV